MFRRRSQTAATDADGLSSGTSASGKGRATPSRKDAEAARKERTKPQLDRRAAAKATRLAAQGDRAKARAALASGDERYLPARDKGPVRRFARDYVDSRRTIGEFMLPLVAVFLFVSFINNTTLRGYAIIAFYLFMIALLVSTTALGLRVRKQAEARFPTDQTRGVGLYAAMRSMQLRRMRMPKAKVNVGEPPA